MMRSGRTFMLWTALLVWGGFGLCVAADTPQVALDFFDTAERHREDGRTGLAIEAYRQALDADPSLVAAYASLGALYHGEGRYEEAYASFAEGAEKASGDRDLLFNAAVLALRLERVDDALGWVNKALDIASGDVELLSLKSAVLQRLERPQEALNTLLRAADARPKDAQIWFRLGNLQHQLGTVDDAAASFGQAVKFDRKFLRAYYNLGAVLFELGRDDEALEAYKVALAPIDQALAAGEAVESLHALAYSNLGAIYLRQEKWQDAASAYGTARRLDPEQRSNLYNQGFVLYQLGRHDEARTAYLEALQYGTEMPGEAYLHLAEMAAKEDDHKAVLRWLLQGQEGLTGSSERLAAAHLAARAHGALGQVAEAEAAWRQVLDRSPGDRTAGLGLGRLLRQRGRFVEAEAVLTSVRRGDGDFVVDLELARIAKATGDREAEMRLYETLLADTDRGALQRPEVRAVQFNLVLTLLQSGLHKDARKWLEPLIRSGKSGSGRTRNGNHGSEERLLQTVHGLLQAAEGDLSGARKSLAAVAAASPNFDTATDALALLDLRRGQAERALQTLGSAPSLTLVERANLGQALWLTGKVREAQTELETAVQALPGFLSGRILLGNLALKRGDFEGAVQAYETARRLCAAEPGGDRGDIQEGSRGDRFELQLGFTPESRRGLCTLLDGNRSMALAARSYARLRGGDPAGARADASMALRLNPPPGAQAVGYFVRGTSAARSGDWAAARQDLERSLGGELEAALQPAARSHLVTVLLRLGDVEAARAELGSRDRLPADLLARAVLLDQSGDAAAALEFYNKASAGLPNRSDVAERIELIEKFY